MLIPELIIYNTLRSLLDVIRTDFKDNESTPEKSILYDLFHVDDNGYDMNLNRFNYYDQSVAIFIKDKNIARNIQVNVGYNTQRVGLPTIHILLPDESKGENGIGNGLGYQDFDIDEESGTYRENYTAMYRSTYTLLITSDNSSEVVLMYHALKNLLFAIFPHFELMGIRQPEWSGADLTFTNDLVPTEIFHRNLSISCFYESTVNSLSANKLIRSLAFKGTPEETNGQVNIG